MMYIIEMSGINPKGQIFDFDDYKQYLTSVVETQPQAGHGFKSKLAKAAHCQLPYVSRVLRGDADFSMDQADALSRYLGHLPDEKHFFLLLVQRARAGSPSLKNYFTEQIEAIRERRLDLSERFRVPKGLTGENQAIYYSHWYYAAIHILVSIGNFQTKENVAKKLGLQLTVAAQALDFLVQQGLIIKKGDRYSMGVARIHVGAKSPFVLKHHQNWRVQSLISLDRQADSEGNDLHYSSIVSLSREDFLRIKEQLIEEIESCNQVIADSKEEILCCLLTDFFEIGQVPNG
ncbi:MAG: DUF4423 domain-containing protein [Bdellovibrionales bacterium]|nr:DUF4423 domain-containing protein [Bdellovibrionales bacterium]